MFVYTWDSLQVKIMICNITDLDLKCITSFCLKNYFEIAAVHFTKIVFLFLDSQNDYFGYALFFTDKALQIYGDPPTKPRDMTDNLVRCFLLLKTAKALK